MDSLVKILFLPLLGSFQIYANENEIYIVKDWYNKGIRSVIDLINENGQLRGFQE